MKTWSLQIVFSILNYGPPMTFGTSGRKINHYLTNLVPLFISSYIMVSKVLLFILLVSLFFTFVNEIMISNVMQ